MDANQTYFRKFIATLIGVGVIALAPHVGIPLAFAKLIALALGTFVVTQGVIDVKKQGAKPADDFGKLLRQYLDAQPEGSGLPLKQPMPPAAKENDNA